ncbi:hypothetical protein A2U01_0061869, partial [Trifolium medium]|nr:hypothetical protein [Trifolium medium]
KTGFVSWCLRPAWARLRLAQLKKLEAVCCWQLRPARAVLRPARAR